MRKRSDASGSTDEVTPSAGERTYIEDICSEKRARAMAVLAQASWQSRGLHAEAERRKWLYESSDALGVRANIHRRYMFPNTDHVESVVCLTRRLSDYGFKENFKSYEVM